MLGVAVEPGAAAHREDLGHVEESHGGGDHQVHEGVVVEVPGQRAEVHLDEVVVGAALATQEELDCAWKSKEVRVRS